jgi:hypothetical protein
MRWSRIVPKVNGYYWFTLDNYTHVPKVVRVYNGVVYFEKFNRNLNDLDFSVQTLWCGPLEAPRK